MWQYGRFHFMKPNAEFAFFFFLYFEYMDGPFYEMEVQM
jgi:hypothetical protein